jgi:hypothetical protein
LPDRHQAALILAAPLLLAERESGDARGEYAGLNTRRRIERKNSPASILATLRTELINCGMIDVTTYVVCQTGQGPRISW